MIAGFKWYLDPLFYPSTKKKVGPPLTKLSGSTHVMKPADHDPHLFSGMTSPC